MFYYVNIDKNLTYILNAMVFSLVLNYLLCQSNFKEIWDSSLKTCNYKDIFVDVITSILNLIMYIKCIKLYLAV